MSNIKSVSRNDVTSIRRSLHRNSDLAVLGQSNAANSKVTVDDRPGYWWVRYIQAGGTYGPPVQVRGCLQAMTTTPGTPVKMGIIEGEKAVLSVDFVSLTAQGVNPTQSAVVDPNANNPAFVNQAFIATAFEQIVEGTLTVALRGAVPLAAGVFVKVEGLFDFTGNIPTSGNHCLAVTAIQSDLVTTETQYSTAKPDQIPLDLDDLNEAWALMSDPLTNAPLWGWDIGDGITELVESNRWIDLRQIINFLIAGGGGSSFYQTVQGNGTPATQEPIIDFINGTNTTVTVTDDGPGTRTKVKIDATGGGTGDVVGPSSAVNNDLAAFDTTTGKLIKDSGLTTANAGKAIAALADKFILQTPDTTNLPNAQAMSALSTGLVKNTTATGVQSIAVAGTDYLAPAAIGTTVEAHSTELDTIAGLSPTNGNFLKRVSGAWAAVNIAASDILSGTLALARGGTNADLSATGSAINFLRQSLTHVITSDIINASDAPIGFATVRVIATSVINLASAPAAIDGVTMSSGDLVGLVSQSGSGNANVNNGLWLYPGSGSAFTTRPNCYNTGTSQPTGYTILAREEGTANKGAIWRLVNSSSPTVDTTGTIWLQDNAIQVSTLLMTTSPATDSLMKGDSTGLGAWLAPGSDGQSVISDGTNIAYRDILYPKNEIINSGFGLWSRQSLTAGTLASYSDDTYSGADQWYVLTETASIQNGRIAGDTNSQFAAQLKQNQASAQRMGYAQILENFTTRTYRSRPVHIQARIRISNSQAVRFAIVEWTGTADSPTSDIVNTWSSSTYTPGNFFIATTTTVTAVGSITPSANTWTNIKLTGTPSGSANNLIVFFWTEGTAAQNVTLDISQVAFTDGTNAVPWIMPDEAQEGLRAARFLQVLASASGTNTRLMSGGVTSTTTNSIFVYQPPVYLRIKPTLTATGSDWQIISTVTAVDLTAIAIDTSSTAQTVMFNCTSGATTAGLPWFFRGDAGADRYLIMSAEL